MRGIQPCGDEVWDVESDCSDVSDASSDSDAEPQKTVGPLQLPTVMKSDSDTQSDDSDTERDEEVRSNSVAPSCPPSRRGPQLKLPPLATQLIAKLPPPEAAPKSARGQVTYLRRENELLRDALFKLQQEAEKVAEQDSGSAKTLDFAHLLELAREFGEDFDLHQGRDNVEECYGEDVSTVAPGSISISTPDSSPRGEQSALSCSSPELVELRDQLAESRREASQLRAQIAVRDSELAILRHAAGIGEDGGH